MLGPGILARFLEVAAPPDRYGHAWQYNSQSDRHSKVGCWAVALDLLVECPLLRQHASEGKVILGVNHPMLDFVNNREKALDLVIAKPSGPVGPSADTFKGLVHRFGIILNEGVSAALDSVPDIAIAGVGAPLIALEAKATMTAHSAAKPRLYDELSSSHQAVHGASASAIAIGYVQINAAEKFASSVSNRYSWDLMPPTINQHKQPKAVLDVLQKIEQLPRRSGAGGIGFDGIGVTVLDLENMGGPVTVVKGPPAPQPGNAFHYETMIVRMATEYSSRFANI